MTPQDDAGWSDLATAYGDRGVVLALGAGASVQSGLPTWGELLRRISRRAFGEGGPALLRRLVEEGYRYPAIGSILEAECAATGVAASPAEFTHLIRHELYREFPFYPGGVDDANRGEFLRVLGGNSTLRAVAGMCAMRRTDGEGFAINPRVHAVVNLNLDALLRAYTYERYRTFILKIVERASAGSYQGRISEYHMHGYLHFDHRYFGNVRREPGSRVFTEQEYFDFFDRPNSAFNYTFLYLLREYSCLFIGMSMLDDNVRRLLHYSRVEREQSYRSSGRAERAERKSLRHFAVLGRMDSADLCRITESSLRRLGVRVLWLDDFEELPARLRWLYETMNGNWEAVA